MPALLASPAAAGTTDSTAVPEDQSLSQAIELSETVAREGDGSAQDVASAPDVAVEPVDTSVTEASAVGSASYPVPAGAKFVAPGGSDSAPGTMAQPWRTVAKAVQAAPSGSTIVVRAGTYNEDVDIVRKRLTLQNYPGEAVWFDGSIPVSGWVRDGDDWRKDGWTPRFDSSDPSRNAPPAFRYVDSRYPMALHPDMVFIDGVPLRQVGSRAGVVPGTFYLDKATSKLYVGSSPVGRAVRASNKLEALYLNNASGSVVRGLGFRRYATPVSRHGTVKAFGDNIVLEGNAVVDNATAGVGLKGANIRVQRNVVSGNGQLGISVNLTNALRIEGNTVSRNNLERFNEIPVAGGVKITNSQRTVVKGNTITGNLATGLWFDVQSYDVRALRNRVEGNTRHGINFEISGHALIAGNTVVNNEEMGIRVLEANDAKVWNNTLVRNGRGIDILDGDRVSSDPLISMQVKNTVVRNNIVSGSRPSTTSLFSVNDVTRKKSGSQMASADHNAWHRPAAATPKGLVIWSNYPSNLLTFPKLTDFRSRTGQEPRGLAFDNVTDPFFVNAAAGDYRVRAGAPVKGKGAPLPASIAADLGLPAGVPVDMGAPAN